MKGVDHTKMLHCHKIVISMSIGCSLLDNCHNKMLSRYQSLNTCITPELLCHFRKISPTPKEEMKRIIKSG